MSDFLEPILNDEEHNRKLADARNRADKELQKENLKGESQRRISKENLIPATPELNCLKEYLAAKRPVRKVLRLRGCIRFPFYNWVDEPH